MKLSQRLLAAIEGEAVAELRQALRRAFRDAGSNRVFQVYLEELNRERLSPPAAGPRRRHASIS